ncbi:hypothetical protein JCM17845_16630 [Iodidimonas gelatinilytica]|uniref:Uncharacterized protein n=1 Tax=Iodidimonas gelatinilytica TaxID=1236966 RepID=A0A5A7N117_9PROT|nr:hypothetical protein [Iodidimonas gelatinilytica]GER01040.1 hypothetical protein JCM17845_16630 [Iodidimonas gelatinilytica]
MTTRTSQTPGGANGRRVILLEFNELCPPLLDRWMGEGKLPNFKVLHDRSKVFETLADEPEGPNLEPWIQWHSIHTGQPFSDHKVFHLTEGKRYKGTDWYEHFRENGLSVASFGSMNVRPFAEEGSLFLADPWSEDDDAYPADLNLFNAYVARQIREYTNEKNQPGWRDHLRFGLFLLGHGLSISTITATIRQLLQEWGDRRYGFQRVAILDRIYMDVFSHYYRKLHPNFATIFLNSTAHLQHAYWRHLEPEKFHIPPTDPEFYRDAILFGYQSMDRLLGRFMHLAAKEGAQLAFATALSSNPF